MATFAVLRQSLVNFTIPTAKNRIPSHVLNNSVLVASIQDDEQEFNLRIRFGRTVDYAQSIDFELFTTRKEAQKYINQQQ